MSAAKQAGAAGSAGPERSATVSIYQNSEHVSGILQQLLNLGLLTSEEVETTHEVEEGSQRGGGLSAGGEGGIDVPLVANLKASLKGNLEGRRTKDDRQGDILRRKFDFSQAYYLHLITGLLRDGGQVKRVGSAADAEGLRPGDFIEYQATFRANEIGAILDIATPDLVAAIVRRKVLADMLRGFDAFAHDFEAQKAYAAKCHEKADMESDLARSITEAIRVDFRSAATQEYYGKIGDGVDEVTAVTICDGDQFLLADKDRLLDGVFTVLAKVSAPVQLDASLLQRIKLLYRLNTDWLDEVFETLQKVANSAASKDDKIMKGMDPAVREKGVVDMKLSARIDGPSFKAVPIAIYL